MSKTKRTPVGTYIDLFSGCGGLSLGLGNAGWQGLFAVEKDPMAFATFKHNMIDGNHAHFDWPEWLPQEATTIQDILIKHREKLEALSGKVDLIAGGPPCQGFSLAGMRDPKDPRNKLSNEYIKMVEMVRPKYILLENVRGFNSSFKTADGRTKKRPQSEIVREAIENLGYNVKTGFLNSSDFGVPQSRTRFILLGTKKNIATNTECPFSILEKLRPNFLSDKGLNSAPVSVKDAISDLEISRKGASLKKHSGSDHGGFMQLDYKRAKSPSNYQRLMMHSDTGLKPNSLRLARHKPSTVEKFKLIHRICKPGKSLSDEDRALIGTKKQSTCVLDPKQPSRTLTTLPDDILHYSEPRILTVRESARIQSFPDSFHFKGKYTTGGHRRTMECPRYTQVGNAVPPLLGEALGSLIVKIKERSIVET